MSGYLTARDLAAAYYARLATRREQDDACDVLPDLNDLGPTDEELEAYYADQDAQVLAYRS
jgi:hypothetical protein